MSSSDVFMTGATGFVGQSVLAELTRSGRSVTALVREPISVTGATTVVGQLNVLEEHADVIGGSGAIVHLASGRTIDRERVMYQDIMGTAQLLDFWKRGPFVYSSSATVHGPPTGMVTPQVPVDIGDWYNAGKAVNEFQIRHAVGANVPERGTGISLRPALLFGANPGPRTGQYLNSYLFHAAAGHTFTFDSDEDAERAGVSFIGTGDFGRAVVAALDRGVSGGFPVASGFVTYRDLLDMVNRIAGASGKVAVKPPSGPNEIRVPHSRIEIDNAAFTAQTGWQPQESLEELVAAQLAGGRTPASA